MVRRPKDQPAAPARMLGRHVEHDPRSRDYAAPEPGEGASIEPVLWTRYAPILDQGNLGSCTGNAMAGWLGCAPHCAGADQAAAVDEDLAVKLYTLATELDGVPGQYPPDDTGSSGNAVAKAARQLKLITGYRWCFTTSSLLHALQHGPVIAGIVWYEGMFTPLPSGEVRVGGQVAGGHEILIRGYHTADQHGPERLLCDNSWGVDWGDHGTFWMSLATWAQLRKQQADVTVPHP